MFFAENANLHGSIFIQRIGPMMPWYYDVLLWCPITMTYNALLWCPMMPYDALRTMPYDT